MQPSLWGSSLKFVILLCFLNTIFSTHSLECQWTDKSLALKENKLFITFATVYNGELSCFCDLLNKYVLYLTFKSYFRAVNNGLNCLMLLSLNSEGFVYINIDKFQFIFAHKWDHYVNSKRVLFDMVQINKSSNHLGF